MRLEGLTALVTGGASGIGAATCRRLAAEGARVAVTDLDLDGAREVAAEIDGDAHELDVTEPRAGRRGRGARSGTVDVLVNNAGTDRFGFFTKSTPDMWDVVLDVNLRGLIAMTHAVLPGDAGARRRPDREHRLRGRPRRLAGLERLLGRQGGRDRLHQGDRPRVGALRGEVQRDRARARSRRRC